MKKIEEYQVAFTSTQLSEQVQEFLSAYHDDQTVYHSVAVAEKAKKLARRFHVSEEKAFVSGLLHDISCVIPTNERVAVCKKEKIPILPEEYQVPMLLHQKQSACIAQQLFNIQDTDILSAIEMHTTLRKGATDFDKVVFLADKIKWDREGIPPYLAELNQAATHSLNLACNVYINWLRSDALIIHPWLQEAWNELQHSMEE